MGRLLAAKDGEGRVHLPLRLCPFSENLSTAGGVAVVGPTGGWDGTLRAGHSIEPLEVGKLIWVIGSLVVTRIGRLATRREDVNMTPWTADRGSAEARG